MVERWVPVVGHDGYEVSDLGRIRSYRSRQGHPIAEPRLMSPGRRPDGYGHIKLGRSFQSSLHAIVLTAFAGPAPATEMECRHIDGNPSNNRADNLQWGTKSDNYHDRHAHGTDNSGERHGNSKLTVRAVEHIRSSKVKDADLALMHGVTNSTVNHVRTGLSWRSVGGVKPLLGTPRVGERNGRAKLNDGQVIAIRESDASVEVLSSLYGVSRTAVRLARTRQTWRHLP